MGFVWFLLFYWSLNRDTSRHQIQSAGEGINIYSSVPESVAKRDRSNYFFTKWGIIGLGIGLIPDPLYFRMSQSPSDRPPAALTVTTSLAGLTSSWLNLALNADRLDEELSSKSAESLFIRLCEQISRIPDPELPKEDLPDIQIHKRKERFSYTWVHAGVHALVVRDGIWNSPKSISFLYRYLSFLFELPQKRRISFPVLLLPEN